MDQVAYKEESDKLFSPKSSAAKVLIPLLDALKWQGNNSKIMESLVDSADIMDTDGLMETMANLNFKHYKIGRIKGSEIDKRILPVLIVKGNSHLLILSMDENNCLVYDGKNGIYKQMENKSINGEIYCFQYADDVSDSLIQQQENWFGKLIYRFRKSILSLGLLTLLITLLDLLLPLFVVLIYDRILSIHSVELLLLTLIGIAIYIMSTAFLNHLRDNVLNYISTRMGWIISSQTFTRLVYLSPSYTETASINSQISRIKDFEGLKRFVTSGNFIAIFNLAFSSIYVIAIIFMGGWIGIIPIITLILLILTGFIMRPFHKIKMEKQSETYSQRQQSLIEILKNVDEIKISGSKNNWIERFKKFTSADILSNYKVYDYANLTNNISYFITNASVLVLIYGGVVQVFAGRMTTGGLIGVLMLYWKVIASIRSVFSLLVQISGLKKSVAQINRFMKLPQDSNLKTNMISSKDIKGKVSFIDVSIRYNSNSNPAILNVNFNNYPGQILGITGHDGAGKSTILKLILGMYVPQGGRIIIDNVNIKQLEPLFLRKSISYSPEKDMILSGTLRDNFRSYNPTITDSKIMDLADKTGLSEYFNLFGYGLDTELNEKMINEMSLSFKKLFNLTRMLSRNSKLYLIDQPENHLNRKELEKIIGVIKELAKYQDSSVIISTKDSQILEICDNVVHLNQGRVSTVN